MRSTRRPAIASGVCCSRAAQWRRWRWRPLAWLSSHLLTLCWHSTRRTVACCGAERLADEAAASRWLLTQRTSTCRSLIDWSASRPRTDRSFGNGRYPVRSRAQPSLAIVSSRGPPATRSSRSNRIAVGWCGGSALVVTSLASPPPPIWCSWCRSTTSCAPWTAATAIRSGSGLSQLDLLPPLRCSTASSP